MKLARNSQDLASVRGALLPPDLLSDIDIRGLEAEPAPTEARRATRDVAPVATEAVETTAAAGVAETTLELAPRSTDAARPTVLVAEAVFEAAAPMTAAVDAASYSCACPACANGSGAGFDSPVSNGSGGATASVGRTFDQRIDGLLSGVKWAQSSITYSDPDSRWDYQLFHPEAFSNFQQINAAQLRAAHATLNDFTYTQSPGHAGFSVEGFTNLDITYLGGGTGAGSIRLANTSNPNTAYAYYPSSSAQGGDVFFGNSGRNPTVGNYDYLTVVHEIGHALGLKHGHETGGFGAVTASWDSMEYTVMTYRSYVGGPTTGYTNEAWGYAQTFMMLDIAALQHMYGADFTTNAGNTVYSWSPTTGQSLVNGLIALTPGGNRIFQTIWDGGGVDTYDLSNYATDLSIDLNPGSHSTFSTAQRAALGNGNIARGNVFNALLYNGDLRSLIENAIGGSGNDTIIGNVGNNALTGNAGNDALYGGAGADTLYGGAGADSLYGGAENDVLRGGDGNDYLDGGTGADNMDGGDGDDTYIVDNAGDVVAEVWGDALGGNDSVYASVSFALSDNIENLYLTGTATSATGNARNNILSGNASANWLDGGAGADTMDGGDGDDTYIVDNAGDVVAEIWGDALGGNDSVYASVSFALSDNIENLYLTGTATSATGNARNNILSGNASANWFFGRDGNDTIYGRGGADSLFGEGGDDVLYGGTGGDWLDGGAGADTMDGGSGNDTYIVDNALDRTIEAAGGGIDTVRASISWTLAANVENLVLTGGALNGSGNGLANTITGNNAANTLRGFGGSDILLGGLGADILIGGTGADIFRYTAISQSTPTSRDIIRAGNGAAAFEGAGPLAGDRIDVSGIDANIFLVGNQSFAFGGQGLGRLWTVDVGSNTHVRANTGTGGTYDFEIVIEDGAVLASAYTAADFFGVA